MCDVQIICYVYGSTNRSVLCTLCGILFSARHQRLWMRHVLMTLKYAGIYRFVLFNLITHSRWLIWICIDANSMHHYRIDVRCDPFDFYACCVAVLAHSRFFMKRQGSCEENENAKQKNYNNFLPFDWYDDMLWSDSICLGFLCTIWYIALLTWKLKKMLKYKCWRALHEWAIFSCFHSVCSAETNEQNRGYF